MKDKDVYLPQWVGILGIVFIVGAIICIYFCFKFSFYFLIGCLACFSLGIAAVLCWRNQWIKMISDQEFEYSSMFGKKTKYHFAEIKDVKMNTDSSTLIFENGKVHLESCAIVSEKFEQALKKYL